MTLAVKVALNPNTTNQQCLDHFQRQFLKQKSGMCDSVNNVEDMKSSGWMFEPNLCGFFARIDDSHCKEINFSFMLNSLPNEKILDQSKFKAFAGKKINLAEKVKFVFGRVEVFSFSHNVFRITYFSYWKKNVLKKTN